MGLDQYAFAVRPHKDNTPLFYNSDTVIIPATENTPAMEIEPVIEIAYWRKHPNLQGWMESLWESKGGENTGFGSFNCVPVELTLADLKDLEDAILGKDLPSTTGFFFGEDSDDYYKEKDLEFIAEARKAIAGDYQVYYSSWW